MKETRNFNYRVVIYPRSLGDLGCVRMSDSFLVPDSTERERKYKERCDDIATDVKRHVDFAGDVVIEHDTESACSFCENSWEISADDTDPEWPKGCPLCCQRAIDEWKAEQLNKEQSK